MRDAMVFLHRSGREDGGGKPYVTRWFSRTVLAGRGMVERNRT